MTLPKRRKAARMSVRESTVIRSPSHLAWVRKFECSVPNCQHTAARIEAAHVRTATDGGTGMKPSDHWAIPLCAAHHWFQHEVGESEFERVYGIDMKKIAEALAKKSPHLRRLKNTA